MWSYFMYLAGYGETDAPTVEEVNEQEPCSEKQESENKKLESEQLDLAGDESDSSTGSQYLPHDHGLYGPTSKAIFKKQFVERNFGLLKKPSLNTPLIKFMLALSQMCMIIDASVFFEVTADHKDDMERVMEKRLSEYKKENGYNLSSISQCINTDCYPWNADGAETIFGRMTPFILELGGHVYWNFIVFSIIMPQYLMFNTFMQVLGKDTPTIWSIGLMLAAFSLWVKNCTHLKHSVPEEGKFGGFRDFNNCHIYMGYLLHVFFVMYVTMVIIRYIMSNCPKIKRIPLLGKVLEHMLPRIEGLLLLPMIAEIFVTASGHYAVEYYSMQNSSVKFLRKSNEEFKKEETRMSVHIAFHLCTTFSILFTEYLKHQATFHNPAHVIDRKTFKENFMQFLPMYEPGGPFGGPPHTWTDDWMRKKV